LATPTFASTAVSPAKKADSKDQYSQFMGRESSGRKPGNPSRIRGFHASRRCQRVCQSLTHPTPTLGHFDLNLRTIGIFKSLRNIITICYPVIYQFSGFRAYTLLSDGHEPHSWN
jgi:hypothetical protein